MARLGRAAVRGPVRCLDAGSRLTLCVAVLLVAAAAAVPAGGASGGGVDPFAGLSPASAPAGADAIAHGVEIPGLRSEFTRTYEGQHGLADLVASPVPLNYRDSLGRWQPIDDSLVPASSGGFTNAADAYRASLPTSLASPVVVSGDGDSVSWALEGASGQASVAGDTATYKGVLTDTDVSLEATSAGLKEQMLLKGADAPTRFVYDLSVNGDVSPSLDPSGGVVFKDTEGKVRFRILAPVVVDAAGVAGRASFALMSAAAGWKLTLSVDGTWLTDSSRVFPVTVDPTTTPASASQQCELDAATPTTSNCAAAWDLTSTGSGGDMNRSIVQFSPSVVDAIPYGSTIVSSTLSVDVLWSGSTTSGMATAQVYPVQASWSQAATWNSPNGDSSCWASPCPGSPYDNSLSSSFAIPGQPSGQASTWENTDITSIVDAWVGGKYGGEWGLGFGGLSPSGSSLTIGTGSSAPTLSITYAPSTGVLRQFRYYTQQLDDRMGLSVNEATGDLEIKSSDINIANGDVSILQDRLYDSLRTSIPTDLSLGWEFSIGQDVALARSQVWNVWNSPDGSTTPEGRSRSVPDAFGNPAYPLGDGEDATAGEGPCPSGGYNGEDGDSGPVNYNTSGMSYCYFVPSPRRDGSPYPSPPPKMYHLFTGGLTDSYGVTYNPPGSNPSISCTTPTIDGVNVTLFMLATQCKGSLTTGYTAYQITKIVECPGLNLTSVCSSPSRTWSYGYDTQGRLTSFIDPTGAVTSYGYNAENLVDQITTPCAQSGSSCGGAGNITLISYDPTQLGRVTGITREDSSGNVLSSVSFAYNIETARNGACPLNEHYTSETDAVGQSWTYCFDYLGRPDQYVDPQGNTRDVVQSYGAYSQPSMIYGSQDDTSSTANTFDASTGNLLASSSPAGASASATYGDGAHPYAPTSTTDAQGSKLNISYSTSPAPLVASVKADNGNPSSPAPEQDAIIYSHGLPTSITLGPAGPAYVSYAYNSTTGTLTSITPIQAMKPTTFTYDSDNRVATETDGNGTTASYHYDGDDRVTEIDYRNPNSGYSAKLTYTFDADGNLMAETDPNGTRLLTYDALNRTTTDTYLGQVVNYDYYPDSNLKDVWALSGAATSYTYNPDGELATLTDPATNQLTDPLTAKPAVVKFAWDTDAGNSSDTHGNLVSIDEPVGSNGTQTGDLVTTYGYDKDDHITSLSTTNGSNTLQQWGYTYTDTSNRQTDLRQYVTGPAGQATIYDYDYLNRLRDAVTTTSIGAPLFSYAYCFNGCPGHSSGEEGASNLLQTATTTASNPQATTNYTYNPASELTRATTTGQPTVIFSYDADGNQVTGSTSYQYNPLNQLTQYTLAGASPVSLTTGGNTNDQLTDLGGTSIDNSDLGILQTTTAGSTTQYSRMPDGQLIDSYSPDGTNAHYYLLDDRQSVTGTAAQANGTLDQSVPITYDPYGNPQTPASGTPPAIPTFGYDSGLQTFNSGNATSNLLHFGDRYYAPSTGTWTQQDPMGITVQAPTQSELLDPTGLNVYAYAGENPVNNADPTGKRYLEQALGPCYNVTWSLGTWDCRRDYNAAVARYTLLAEECFRASYHRDWRRIGTCLAANWTEALEEYGIASEAFEDLRPSFSLR